MDEKALMDFFTNLNGNFQAHGSTASKLLKNGMSVKALRTNDLLRYDEWKEIDRAVMMAYQIRLVGVADLMARNLVYNIPNGLGKLVLGTQDMSDGTDAEVSMDAKTRARRDKQEFDINYLPLPLIHKDFSYSIREIESSRREGTPISTIGATVAARKVAEMIEQILFRGYSTYTFGGGSIYGYEDATYRNTGSLTAPWNDSAATGETILADVLAMKQAAIDDRCYGPYMLYIPTQYETAIDGDFKTNSDKSIRQRILETSNIIDVKVADKLTSTRVALIQMTEDVIRLVNGMNIITVQWEEEGGMEIKFKVMAIQIPQTRNDQDQRSGIIVFTE